MILVLCLFCYKSYGGVYFSGGSNSQTIYLPDNPNLRLSNTDNITICAWIYLRAYETTFSNIIRYDDNDDIDGDNPDTRNLYGFRITSLGKVQFFFGSTSGTLYVGTGTNTINLKTWYFICAIKDYLKDKVYVYVNTIKDIDDVDNSTGVWTTTGQYALIGRYKQGTSYENFNGIINELSVWKDVLSPSELKILSNSKTKGIPLQIRPQNLVLYMPLDDWSEGYNGNSTYVDKSGNRNHGTAYNNPVCKAESVLSYP